MIRVSGLVVLCLFVNASTTQASVQGVAVGSVGSATEVGIKDAGRIKYFIPLSSAASGVYGNGNIGTVPDSGSGYGYDDPNLDALQMFLRFDTTSLSVSTILEFVFDDLDLIPVNDPRGFWEDVQFNYFDAVPVDQELTGTILDADIIPVPGLLSGVTADISHGGPDDAISIAFGGSGLTDIVNASFLAYGAFYMRLDFSSKADFYGHNTAEYFLSGVMTTGSRTPPVPEPSTLAIWSLLGGVGIIAGWRRKRKTA